MVLQTIFPGFEEWVQYYKITVHEPLAQAPSVQIINGGKSHVNSPALLSDLNDRGCWSEVSAAAPGEESLTILQEFQRITEQHMAERGIGRRSNDQLGKQSGQLKS